MCDAINICNTQQTFKKIMDGNLFDIIRLLKNRQKSESFAAHSKHHFNTTTSHTDIHKYMTFKVVMKLYPIDAMNTLAKPKCNLCMEERLETL